MHGYYPNHILKYWRRKEIKVDVTEEDLADLTDGTVDYIGFSYYMSFAIDAHRDNNPHFDYLETERFGSKSICKSIRMGLAN